MFGSLNRNNGVGHSARGYIDALQAVDIPVTAISRNVEVHSAIEPNINLIVVDAEAIPAFMNSADAPPNGRRNIGVWPWEARPFPERYRKSFRYVDEVWAPSNYVRDIIAELSPVPVFTVPHAITAPAVPPEPPPAWPFTFMFTFDFGSFMIRKNPLNLVRAYRLAFPEPGNTALVLKTVDGHKRQHDEAAISGAIADRPDITLINAMLPAHQRDALLASCHCYVSLHRSEGFGLTVAEAMLFGKPIICTNYSGTTDFATPETAFLVGGYERKVGLGGRGYYPADSVWFEPSIEEAARHMRTVYEDYPAALQVAERGRAKISKDFSVKAVGKIARSALASSG